jgi:formylglycine-generating enzyme required for sulfatase activity
MRVSLVRLGCLLSMLIASSASAVTMDWTPIGDAGNACDPEALGCFGSVGYSYSIGTYEVTNAQYAEFLTAAGDSRDLYNQFMGYGYGGITGSCTAPGSCIFTPIAGRESMPVNYVSFYDALRFVNWMNNGQGSGDTETGAYTLVGPYTTDQAGNYTVPANGATISRNPGATIVLPNEDEWYKAAYYNALSANYFGYPTSSDTQTTCTAPAATANLANCDNAIGDVTRGGSYSGSASPYGTFDQGGDVWEWNETVIGSNRAYRGGSFAESPFFLSSFPRYNRRPTDEAGTVGFRIAMIPEPGTGVLVIGGLVGLAIQRRARD